jgi:hypothetical protein
MSRPTLKAPVRFGWLRGLVALCPGFGTLSLMILFVYLEWCFPALRFLEDSNVVCSVILIATCLILAVGSGWFYAMLDPIFPKIEGDLNKQVLIRYITNFVALQIVIAPIVFAVTALVVGSFLP